MSILKLLANGNFITVNKCVAKSIGLNESVILGALCSEFVYCESRGLTDGGFFPFSIELLQEETTLGRKQQDKAIDNLVNFGVIEKRNFGMPSKRHFRIIEENVEALILGQTSLSVEDNAVCPNGANYISNNNIYNITSKKVEVIKDTDVESAQKVSQDVKIAEIISAWNRQKNIRTTIDRIAPLSKRYNDTFLCIAQFGYEAFIYEILSLDNNAFFEEWQPSYDWFCAPNNFNKVYDGNYRYRTGKKEIDWENL